MENENNYKNLRKIEKLTIILSSHFNKILNKVSFGAATNVMLISRDKAVLNYYVGNEYEILDHFSRTLDIDYYHSNEDIQRCIDNECAVYYNLKHKNVRRYPIGKAHYIGKVEEKDIYVLPLALYENYPKGLLLEKIYEVYVEEWFDILDDPEEYPIFTYSTAMETVNNLYWKWSCETLACCRALHEGGFNTGYGDPYESVLLYGLISSVASLNYEKRHSNGTIIGLPCDSCNDQLFLLKIENNIPLDDNLDRTYRKLLEMTTDEIAMAFGQNRVLGLVDSAPFDWKIKIIGQGKWKYYYKDQVIFTIDNRKIIIGKEAEQIKYHLPEEVANVVTNANIIEKIVQQAMKQNHGTSIIFTNNAQEETNRLNIYRRCIKIAPLDLLKNHEKLLLPITSIDGALILDFEGICYGVGAILDGEAYCNGDFGRGARYNSALNYIRWKSIEEQEHEYCAVIISEDGIHDIISTNNIDDILEELKHPYDYWGIKEW